MVTQSSEIKRIKEIAAKHHSSAVIDWHKKSSEVFEFSLERRVYKLGSMQGHVQQVEPNKESTIIVFTVKEGGEMKDHDHLLPLPHIESIVCMYGEFWIDLRNEN